MRKISLLFTLFCLIGLSSCEELNEATESVSSELTNEEIIAGLRNALTVGTDTSVATLNAKDGYFKDELVKVLMPAEAQPILNGINDLEKYSPIPLQPLVDDVVESMNRSAEKAAVKAKPIFVDAVTNMTISDGLDILYGEDNAATQYLQTNTYTSLKSAFQPDIQSVLEEPLVAGTSTESLYAKLVKNYNIAANAYNTANILGVLGENKTTVTDTSLTNHVTTKALDGLFLKVEAEEKDIRKDPIARVTDILTKVFGKLDE